MQLFKPSQPGAQPGAGGGAPSLFNPQAQGGAPPTLNLGGTTQPTGQASGTQPAGSQPPTLNLGQPSLNLTSQQPGLAQPQLNLGVASGQAQPAPGTQPVAQGGMLQPKPAGPARKSLSFRFVLSELQKYLHHLNPKALDNYLTNEPEILRSISLCLLYFKPLGEASSRSKLFDAQNPLKWGGKEPLTPSLANGLIVKLAENIRVDELITFDIVDAYFMTNDVTRKNLTYLKTIDQNILNAERQATMLQGGQALINAQLIAHQMKNIDTQRKEFANVSSQIFNELQIVYLQERSALLQCVLLLLKNPMTKDGQASQHIKDLFKQNLEDNLLNSLKKNSDEIEVFRGLTCSGREVNANIQKEETIILQCLLKIYKSYELPKSSQILKFLQYSISTQFKGLRLRPHDYQSDEVLSQQCWLIKSLSIQQFFNYFQLHLLTSNTLQPAKNPRLKSFLTSLFSQPKEFTDLLTLIDSSFQQNDTQMDDIQSIIYLTVRQFLEVLIKLDLFKQFGMAADKMALVQKLNMNKRGVNSTFMEFMVEIKRVDDMFYGASHSEEGGYSQGEHDLHMLIQDWINLVFPYLLNIENWQGRISRPEQENLIEKAADLTFSVIQQPQHLRQIWSMIESNGELQLFGKRRADKVVYHTLDIFKEVLEEPFMMENFGKFTLLMTALCGDKRHKFGLNALSILQDTRLDQVIPSDTLNPALIEFNVLRYMLLEFFRMTESLEDQRISTQQQFEYRNLVVLLTKMISQDQICYHELNREAIQVMLFQESEQDEYEQKVVGATDYHRSAPLLSYLQRAFLTMIQNYDLSELTEPIKGLMNSFSFIYKNIGMEQEMLWWLQSNINHQGTPLFVEFFVFNLNEYEYPQNIYPITRAYLKFMKAIFQKQHPQQYLQSELRTNISETVLQKLMFHVYQPLLQNFQRLAFRDLKDFLKLTQHLLKLTKTFLSKFHDVLPQMKAGLSSRYPQYDELLRLISECLNSENIESIIIQPLMLAEDGRTTYKGTRTPILTNKFWLDHLKSGGSGSSSAASQINRGISGVAVKDGKMRVRVQKMIKESLKCLNSLMQLAYHQIHIENLSQEQKANIGAKAYYLQHLKCVSSMSSLARFPGQWEQYQIESSTSLSYSLFNIIQYYVKPHVFLCPYISRIQIEAIRFLLNCCKIWETQPLGQRVSLESTLRTPGMTSQDIMKKYLSNLKEVTKAQGLPLYLRYLSTFLDLLIVSSSTQASFVIDLFKEQEIATVFTESLVKRSISVQHQDNNPAIDAMIADVESKIVILLSEMSSNKICEAFLRKLADDDDLVRLYDNVIRNKLDLCIRNQNIFSAQQQISQDIKHLNLFMTSQAYITVKYFMRLLSDEYQKNTESQTVKKAIRLTFENPQLTKVMSAVSQSVTQKSKIILQELLYFNDIMRNFDDVNFRNRALIKDLCNDTDQKLTPEQIDLQNNIANKLVTLQDSSPVFLNNLDAVQLLSYLRRQTHPYEVVMVSPLSFEAHSKLGTNFMINTEEFIATARTYFYEDEALLGEVKRVSETYNMCLSYMYAYQQFVSGQRDFILTIGKARMRENMRHRELVLQNKAMSTSLFNLVISDNLTDLIKNQGAMQGTQTRLAKLLIDIAKPLTKKIADIRPVGQAGGVIRQQDHEMSSQLNQQNEPPFTLSFEQSLNELELDFLSILLGALNSAAEIDDYNQDILKILNTEVLTPMIKGLPKIRQNQMLSMYSKDTSQLVRLENEQKAAQLFINQVLQIFSLSIQVQQKADNAGRGFGGAVQQVTDYDYIQILSDVVKIMHESTIPTSSGGTYLSGVQCFQEGLKILEEGFSLISNDNILLFMRKQDTSPLKVVLQKFLSSQCTLDEKIKIVEFLTSYARIEQGAEHLHQENILKNLNVGSIMALTNQIDFYIMEGVESKRNPIHILWCQILLLIRTMNHVLLTEQPDYLRSTLSPQLSTLWERISALLEFGLHLKDQQFDSKSLSLALFEELELITGLVAQYFEYTDEFFDLDYEHYVELKDRLLFGVMQLFGREGDRQAVFSSSTEQYMYKMTHEKIAVGVLKASAFTGLDMAVEGQKVKTFFNVTSALLNATSLNARKVRREDYINTWDQVINRMGTDQLRDSKRSILGGGSKMNFLLSDYDQYRSLSNLTSAVANMLAALFNMSETFKLWVGAEQHLSQLHMNVCGLFKHDEWINNEYFGLNTYFSGLSFQDLLELFEDSLQMGYLATLMLLQKLKDTYDSAEQAGYISGAAHYMMQGGASQPLTIKKLIDFGEQMATNYRKFETETKRSQVIKEHAVDQEYAKKITDFLDILRKGTGGYRGSLLSEDGGGRSRRSGFY